MNESLSFSFSLAKPDVPDAVASVVHNVRVGTRYTPTACNTQTLINDSSNFSRATSQPHPFIINDHFPHLTLHHEHCRLHILAESNLNNIHDKRRIGQGVDTEWGGKTVKGALRGQPDGCSRVAATVRLQ